ncbi:adenosyl-hopene transferase HpnH [Magnetospira sp. QH-2]|uniref:adenosyl-hopene transferase HpnH n=1 Tax=Magnetospira sp. (strain QH-2) TaxID=1288970 RepID=UPI0003E80D91|nr:adenosyl-hopene transferase HpnH [Magnetospira sp. QH-2]CCQ73412.1 Putative hopanoid biosynthesis associated radical SAM protein HpnH [Magnetospira sp. QH-2]
MGVPLIQGLRVGGYILKQKLSGKKRYPLVLMLEPLFQCNLECAGCGKIAYPKDILEKRLSVEECLAAADECGAPIVSIPGGEPLIHDGIKEIVEGLVARKKFVYLCTNALLLRRKLDLFKPTPYLTLSVHLDGDRGHHDKAVCRDGVFDKAVEAIREARSRGFRVTVNSTLFDDADPEAFAEFFDFACDDLGVEGVTLAPGYAYEKAPVQAQFLRRERTKELFRTILRLGKGRAWRFNQSSLYLDFLAGNQSYRCTPWGNPTRNIFGWQRPCYLVDEGHAATFKELMEETAWDNYGPGNDDRCANCMVHSGYEPTAVDDTVTRPWKALRVALFGPRTEGPMAPDVLEQSESAGTGGRRDAA